LITEEIIINFFEGKCDPQDAAIVQAWLKENPAKLKEYIGVEEWEDFQPAHVLSPDISGRLWNNINKSSTPSAAHYSYFRWMAVAASVVLVAGLSWLFIFKKQGADIISASAVAKNKSIFNNSPSKMTLTLSDGSTVDLSPNSTLSYPENFNSLKRAVILNGEANFSIAKDVARPFFVYSNSVLISVLGTRFTVNSYEPDNATKVILHEGRVMIKISDSSSQDNKNEYYLSPGDIFISKKVNKRSPARILRLEKDKDDCYVFNNYPLDVVFDQLQIIYNTKIIYNKTELGNRSFIGKIDKKDSVYHILQSIALLNNFRLHKQGDSCIIGN
jgi:ferric-dicitrate binding protein FerR (iron transport regulator)